MRAYGEELGRVLSSCVCFYVISELSMKNFLSMLFSKLLKAGAAASLVLTCAGVNAQSWVSNSTYGLYVSPQTGTKGNVAIGVAAAKSYQGNRLTIKADSAKNGLRIYDYKGTTRLLQGSNGGLTVGAASAAPANGLYVAGASNLRSSLTVAGASTFSSATFNSGVTAKSGLIVSSGLAKFDGPVSMNSTMVASGAATFNSGATIIGTTQLAGSLNVTDAATFSKTLNVAGKTTLKSVEATGVANFKGSLRALSTFEAEGFARFNDGAIVKGGLSASLTDHPGYPGSITIGGTEKATIKATEFCGYKPACPKDLYFDAKNYIFLNGNVGIGVEDPQAKLHVDGKILCSGEIEVADLNSNSINVNSLNAKDIQMDMHGAADYVFDENYNLKSLSEVESYVNEHKHLPGMPSAAEMDANGVSVSKMSNLLLEKVEELTLHMIKLEKENAALKAKVESLSK